MTYKKLTGAYPGGYTVANGVDVLDIRATASIGGPGLVGPATAPDGLLIKNDGSIFVTNNSAITLFQTGGTVINGERNHAATIDGFRNGIAGSNLTVANFGTIYGTGFHYAGVFMNMGGEVTNGSSVDTGALIDGYNGIAGVWSTVSNFGAVEGADFGVWCQDDFGSSGAAVTNGSQADGTAYIEGRVAGVYFRYSPGTVTNYGTILANVSVGVGLLGGGLAKNFGTISATGASSTGIKLVGAASVLNGSVQDTTASIEGVKSGIRGGSLAETISNYGTVLASGEDGCGILFYGYGGNRLAATISNFGTVLASGEYGTSILFYSGGRIRNGSDEDTAALIEGGAGGVSLRDARATIDNFGAIDGGSSGGVTMSGAHDVLVNGSSTDAAALIAGSGVSLVSGANDTVVNFGTISGLSLTATSDVLRVEAGCVFETPVRDAGALSLVNGVGTISGLAGGAVVVSGSMARARFSGFETLMIGKSARFTLTGSGMIAAGRTLSDAGILTVTDALVVAGSAKGYGTIALAAGATAQFDAAVPSTLTVSFRAGGSVLALEDPSAFGATIAGFKNHGEIDLLGIAATSAVLEAGDKLVITDGAATLATLQLAGVFGTDTFATSSDGAGGTLITANRGGAAASPPLPPPHALIAAAASLGGRVPAAHCGAATPSSHEPTLLAAPRSQLA